MVFGDSTNTQNVANNKQPPDGRRLGPGGYCLRRRWLRYGGGTTEAALPARLVAHVPSTPPRTLFQQMGDMMAGTMTNNWQRKGCSQIASQSIARGGILAALARVTVETNSSKRLEHGRVLCPRQPSVQPGGYGQA